MAIDTFLLCSNCFLNEGLRIDAEKLGEKKSSACLNCKSKEGKKLTKERINTLAGRFFVRGSTVHCNYGAAPTVQFNEHRYGSGDTIFSGNLACDAKLIEEALQVGFFYYGPRTWMVGEVEPLKELQDSSLRSKVIERILTEYPDTQLAKGTKFYRLRTDPKAPNKPDEYDSPPKEFSGGGRLCSANLSIMYASQDIDICIHECRATVENDIYVATLKTQQDLRLLDLTHVLDEECTEFESLDMAVHMLFLAKSHSYEISREIALAAKQAGYDGLIYPSFFSLIRTGGHPFETAYGLSLRKYLPNKDEYAEAFTIQNIALFGHPIKDGLVSVECINRLILTEVGYKGYFGPVV